MLDAVGLVERYERVLAAAPRFLRQIPAEHLNDNLPHRDRSYLALGNHLVQIAADFMDVAHGADFTGPLAASVPAIDLGVAALEDKSCHVGQALRHWLGEASEARLQRTVVTYFGEQTLHQVLERCVWHSAQHARQLMMVLELLGIPADDPLTEADFAGLPMPAGVWDG